MLYGEEKKTPHIQRPNHLCVGRLGHVRTGSVLADAPSLFRDCSRIELVEHDDFIESLRDYFPAHLDRPRSLYHIPDHEPRYPYLDALPSHLPCCYGSPLLSLAFNLNRADFPCRVGGIEDRCSIGDAVSKPILARHLDRQ